MTISMTGFSRNEHVFESGNLIWEVRSVNHRFLDVHLRLPEDLRTMEIPCRQLFSEHLNRGRIDAQLQYKKSYGDHTATNINDAELSTLMTLLGEIENRHPGLKAPTSLNVLRTPGILEEKSTDKQELSAKAMELLATTLKELQLTRQREGQNLQQVMLERVEQCCNYVAQLKTHLPLAQQVQKEKTQTRIEEIINDTNPERIAQEIALLLAKSDIAEEFDRLDSHLNEVKRLLQDSKPVGRRIDFLMQELNREANTIGSKSIDKQTTNIVIDLKVLIEQMREQTQNIE